MVQERAFFSNGGQGGSAQAASRPPTQWRAFAKRARVAARAHALRGRTAVFSALGPW